MPFTKLASVWVIAMTSVGTLVGCAKSGDPSAAPKPETGAPTPAARTPLVELPPVTTDNGNVLVVDAGPKHFEITASSYYSGYPAENVVDGNLTSSWYSAQNDSAAKGKGPFVALVFKKQTTVRRVTVLGNRDPNWLIGYTIHSGKLELLDANERVLFSASNEGTGNRRDFDFRMPAPVPDVKTVRFTSLRDDGNENQYGDVAIAELQVE